MSVNRIFPFTFNKDSLEAGLNFMNVAILSCLPKGRYAERMDGSGWQISKERKFTWVYQGDPKKVTQTLYTTAGADCTYRKRKHSDKS